MFTFRFSLGTICDHDKNITHQLSSGEETNRVENAKQTPICLAKVPHFIKPCTPTSTLRGFSALQQHHDTSFASDRQETLFVSPQGGSC